eukprot:scaffold13160_cov106-Isochrysis_galbana.AAC.6
MQLDRRRRQLKLELGGVLLEQHGAREELADTGRSVVMLGRLDAQLEGVAAAVLALEVLLPAQAAEAAAGHDAEAVGGEHDGASVALRRDDVPHVPAGGRVHPARRLVQEDHPRRPDEGDGQRELPLVAARIGSAHAVGVRRQRDAVDQALHRRRHIGRRQVLQLREHGEQLARGHQLEQGVELRAIAQLLTHKLEPGRHVVAADPGRALGGQELPGKHRDGGGLAGAVDAEEAKALAVGDSERQVDHSHLWRSLAACRKDLVQPVDYDRSGGRDGWSRAGRADEGVDGPPLSLHVRLLLEARALRLLQRAEGRLLHGTAAPAEPTLVQDARGDGRHEEEHADGEEDGAAGGVGLGGRRRRRRVCGAAVKVERALDLVAAADSAEPGGADDDEQQREGRGDSARHLGAEGAAERLAAADGASEAEQYGMCGVRVLDGHEDGAEEEALEWE